MHSPLIQDLINHLKYLPGVGNKSATRMAYYLLEQNKAAALKIANSLQQAVEKIHHCESCRILTENKICQICADLSRDEKTLCIVGSPADVFAIEQSGIFKGYYFVLMGSLSPLDGIGPNELGLPKLFEKVNKENFQEIILATSTTVEGEGTANYIINELHDFSGTVTRIAFGVPLGGDLEYVDGSTLGHAFSGRKPIS
ncbi:MAG: recombination protein RecR [Gammaproteobacteria bacterium]|nr:recombination protein RecR [Gammaproteobacteria bacterium]